MTEKIKNMKFGKYSKFWLLIALLIVLSPFVSIFRFYQQLEPTSSQPDDLPEFTITSSDDLSEGTLYFEISNFLNDGGLLGTGNYGLSIDHQSLETEYFKRFQSFGMGLERQSETLISFYEYTQEAWRQQKSFSPNAGIPFSSGGQYVLLDENFNFLRTVEDERGIDLHELIVLPNGNFMYLIEDIRPLYRDPTITCLPPGNCGLLGQSIVEVTPAGETVWKWDLLDHYQRSDFIMDDILILDHKILYDVTHANALEIASDGNILISVRHTDEVIKIDRATGDIIWRLGGSQSHNNDFTYRGDSLGGISHQHAPVMLDNGNVLIFDNGNSRTGEGRVSRAVEYALDEQALTATLVWEYSTDEKHFSPNRGSVQRLSNGNTLINFVSRQPNIIEVSPEGEIVLEITLPDGYASYQAQVWQD